MEQSDDGPQSGRPHCDDGWLDRRRNIGSGRRTASIMERRSCEEGDSRVRRQSYDTVGKLDKALDEATAKKWIVVDMKRDWKIIYPFEQ